MRIIGYTLLLAINLFQLSVHTNISFSRIPKKHNSEYKDTGSGILL